jgi:hypothetical protein
MMSPFLCKLLHRAAIVIGEPRREYVAGTWKLINKPMRYCQKCRRTYTLLIALTVLLAGCEAAPHNAVVPPPPYNAVGSPSRYIDKELGVACYFYINYHALSCVKITPKKTIAEVARGKG